MKKNFIALSAAMLCITAAHAQSSVQVTGVVDMFAGSMKYAGDANKKNVVDGGGMTTSWFGFNGTEDLGGGLKANFNLTSFMRADTGTPGRFNNATSNDPFFSRDANVSLSGGFGSVMLGRGLAPNFLPTVVSNPLGDSFTFSPLVLHANVPLFNGSGWGTDTGNTLGSTTPSDTGWSNEIIYSTPSIGGLKANLHYQFGEQAGNSSKKNVGLNALYFGGPLTLTAFYERDQISNPYTPNAPLSATRKDWMLGGAYDFSVAKAFLSYGQSSTDGSDEKAKTAQVGASVPLGGGKVLASYAQTKLSLADISRKTFTVGYDYELSKRTDVYVMLMNDRITHRESGNSFGAGVRHRF